jgi:hypothetical protein
MRELYSFVGFRDGKQVLTIIDVSLNDDMEAYRMFLSLLREHSLDDCDYYS